MEIIQTIQSIGQTVLMVFGAICLLSAAYTVKMDRTSREATKLLRRVLRRKPEKAKELILHMKEVLQQ